MHDAAVHALIELVKREGGGDYKVVAREIGANPRTLYQICAGIKLPSGKARSVGRQLREKLERHYPGWMGAGAILLREPPGDYGDQGTGQTITPAPGGVSHAMRHPTQRLTPPKVSWGALMKTDLPPEFETELPDNAMAPEAPKGARVILLAGPEAEPGDWVLVADAQGQLYFREYRVLRPGRWVAHALNPAFLPLDSVADALRVVAVFDGMRGRRSRR